MISLNTPPPSVAQGVCRYDARQGFRVDPKAFGRHVGMPSSSDLRSRTHPTVQRTRTRRRVRAVAVLRDPFEFAMELFSRPDAAAELFGANFGANTDGAGQSAPRHLSRCEMLLRDSAASLAPFLRSSLAAVGSASIGAGAGAAPGRTGAGPGAGARAGAAPGGGGGAGAGVPITGPSALEHPLGPHGLLAQLTHACPNPLARTLAQHLSRSGMCPPVLLTIGRFLMNVLPTTKRKLLCISAQRYSHMPVQTRSRAP